MKPKLRLPFNGDYPVTFGFGAVSDNEEIKKKFQEWGITGHHGIDYGLSEGTEAVAADTGKVIQSGDNGEWGISVTLEHPWGQSIYAHLKETKVNVGDEVEVGKPIGLSGKTGAAFGEHLHFGIKLKDADANNGYLGFSDPSPYFGKLEETKPEKKPVDEKPTETPPQETKPTEEPSSPQSSQSPEPPLPAEASAKEGQQKQEPEVKEIIKEVIKEVPVVNQEEVNKQVEEKLQERLKTEQDERRKLANEARTQRKKDNLNQILEFVRERKVVTNDDIRDLLHVSRSAATNYLTELVDRGMLKKMGERAGTKYSA
ncbi:hypothetical protein A2617_02940 [Candidatus Daviesbacteria bacterium RIFOXYD1_FULL_41_10]|uniref:CARD domain-containing protein n=2 Tax=Candidatus Daviesiibacteriota TaxID=1752718 RepID=A0A1F5N3B8_9BACT|nr:MAG: Peptidase M23 family protein [Candidatus Daviesbacteria bacterium GW2011_GWB1_41_5]OGE72125.1 MAG: hypothetical protein A2617_02940 [Candidatus Daviesbacteria bacterium RIFOXYD1_FULL_41_10]